MIDIHCHLIPALDDGCQTLGETLESIEKLRAHGFTASVCTPHTLWMEQYPHILPDHTRAWTDDLQNQLISMGIDYTLLPGGELRASKRAVDLMKENGVPTLANSKLVLMDFWEPKWPAFLDATADWLLDQGYTPVLAHPERSVTKGDFDGQLQALTDRGVLLQGNTAALAGACGPLAETYARNLLTSGRYTFLALDLHRPDTLEDRLTGIEMARELVGDDAVEELMEHAPRRLVLDAPAHS
ncbi:MAG: CpsB/CapC family capsule biosynthesis tyrosine phosphatase [Planctomycetota bacterium]